MATRPKTKSIDDAIERMRKRLERCGTHIESFRSRIDQERAKRRPNGTTSAPTKRKR